MQDCTLVNTLAGAFCGVTVDSIIYPLDTTKTCSCDAPVMRRRHQAKMGMVTVKSYTHLFKGLGTILMGSVPASAIYWAIYERTKKALKSSTNDRPELYTVCEMGAAMVAESFASTFRNPFEVTKQFIQVRGYSNPLKAIVEISQVRIRSALSFTEARTASTVLWVGSHDHA